MYILSRETFQLLARVLEPESLSLFLTDSLHLPDKMLELLEKIVQHENRVKAWFETQALLIASVGEDEKLVRVAIERHKQNINQFFQATPVSPCEKGLECFEELDEERFTAHFNECDRCVDAYSYLDLIQVRSTIIQQLFDMYINETAVDDLKLQAPFYWLQIEASLGDKDKLQYALQNLIKLRDNAFSQP